MATVAEEIKIKTLGEVNDWPDRVKLSLLKAMSSGAMEVYELERIPFFDGTSDPIHQAGNTFGMEDVCVLLEELYGGGYIKPSQYVCKCCEKVQHLPEEILEHVIAFELTCKGKDLLLKLSSVS